MVNWLKYFFGGFFLHKYSRENEKRNLLNCLLALVVAFVLFLVGLYAGYVASFSTHLRHSSQFADTVKEVFGDGGVQLTVTNGIASSAVNPRPIDTFSGVGVAPDTGLQVVIDTRKTDKNYAQFEVYAVLKSDGKTQIPYEDYLKLNDEQQAKYSLSVKNLGKPLEFDEQKIQSYNEHLQSASNEKSPFYNVGIVAEYATLTQDDPDYSSKLYELFVGSYYPFMSKFERFAAAPSMKSYYVEQIAEAEYYFVVLDDMCLGRIKTDGGVAVDFSGFFKDVNDCAIGGGQNSKQLVDGATQLVLEAFDASKTNVTSVYVINSITSFPIVVVAAFLVAVAMWFVIRKCHGDFGFFACIKTVFFYFFIGSILLFALVFGLSFAVSREAVYTLAVVGLFAVVLIRSAVFCVTECVLSLKQFRSQPSQDPTPTDAITED